VGTFLGARAFSNQIAVVAWVALATARNSVVGSILFLNRTIVNKLYRSWKSTFVIYS
jgi:hypothetical protein